MKLHRRIGAVAATTALVGTALATQSAYAGNNLGGAPIPAGSTAVNLLTVNDFHGRIDDGKMTGALGKNFACTMITQRDALGAANTLTVGAGDLINASPLASSLQNDLPSIDFLGAIGLQASAVGNHEFDDGLAELRDTYIPRAHTAGYEYLGANVYLKGTTTPAIKAYETYTVNGITVGIVGAVTAETPNLVAGTGIADLDFGDPVEGVNRVIGQLTDGNAANGEADVIVATYHEGGPYSSSTGGTLADQMAVPVFKHLVNDTSAKAAAIIQGHTHQAYVYDVPVPGATDGSTRPVLQTGNYAANVGKIQFGIDPTTKQVVGYNAANVAVTAASPTCQANAQWQQAAAIVDAAVNYAKPIAAEVIGSATAPITRAYLGTSKDDRSRESTMSNLLAQQVLESINAMEGYSADLAFQNPGGVREDLIPSEGNKLNYGQAALVVPFNNTLKTADYTGAQIKAILEEQWQPDGASRPFLAMGVSDNLTYTIDPTKARGERVTSIMLDGAPIDPAATYTVASNAFLITNVGAAPDNFKTFQAGTNYRDTLVQDLDAFVAWIKANSPLSPSFAKQSAYVTPPAPDWKQPIFAALEAGKEATLTVEGTDLTSLNSPANTEFTVYLGTRNIGTATITTTEFATPLPARTGTSTITFTVPADVAIPGEAVDGVVTGSMMLRLVAAPTNTTINLPVTVKKTVTVPTTPPVTTPPVTTPPAGSGGSTPPSTGGGNGGGLAWTGANVSQLLALTTGLLLAGAVLLVISRRRMGARH